MISNLIGDIQATLEIMPSGHRQYQAVSLVADALNQNANFVSRHPTVLFQNLWNALWWYDCPQLKHHSDPTDQDASNTPMLKSPLYLMAGRWLLQCKRVNATESYWVRGLRPGWDRIGSGLIWMSRTTSNAISSLAWSNDGTRIVGGSYDLTARIWNALTGQELCVLDAIKDPLHSTLINQTDWCARGLGSIRDCRWSPCQKYLAAACDDGVVRIFDAETGIRLVSILENVRSISSVAWFSHGNFVVTSSGVIWDWRRQTAVGRVSTFGQDVIDVDCSALDVVACALSDGSIWLENNELTPGKRHQPDSGLICCLKWSQSGRQLAFGTRSGDVRVLCVDSDRSMSVSSQETPILSLAWSHDGNWLATGGANGTVRVLAASGWEEVASFQAHCGRVEGLTWSPDSEFLASGSGDRAVRVWKRNELGRSYRPINHNDDIVDIEWSADGHVLTTRSKDQTLAFWDTLAGVRRGVYSHVGSRCVKAVWSPTRTILAAAMSGGIIRLLDREAQLTATLVDDGGELTSISWDANGKHLISGSATGVVSVWDTCGIARTRTWKLHGSVRCVVSSPNESRVAIATERSEMIIHDIDAGATFVCGCDHDVTNMSWSPDGQYVAAMSWSSAFIQMYSKDGGSPLWQHRVSNHDGVKWSKDGLKVHATSAIGRETFIAATGILDQTGSDVRSFPDCRKTEEHSIRSFYDPLANETTIEVDGNVAGWIPENGCQKNPKYPIWAGFIGTHLHMWLLQRHSNDNSLLPDSGRSSASSQSATNVRSIRMFRGNSQTTSRVEAAPNREGGESDKSISQS